jgi:YD repeat-containing protein
VIGESTTAAAPIAIYNASKRYKYSPNWTYYNTLSNLPWTTPGGDIDTSTVSTQSVGGTINTLYTWDVLSLVQRQASGDSAGAFIVKQQDENVDNMLQFAGSSNIDVPSADVPVLKVWWVPATGAQSRWQFQTVPLTGRSSVSVNLASGNLLLQAGDLHLNGTGLDLSFGHYYNGLNGPVAGKWDFGPGRDTYLVPDQFGDGTAQYTGASGATVAFTRNQDGTYNTPSGLDVTLAASSGTLAVCTNASYAYVITGHSDQSKQYFDSSGYLIGAADNNGNANCYRYDANHNLTSIVDSKGRTTSFARTSTTTTITDPGNRTYVYTFNTSGRLTKYTDAAGKNTMYAYDANGMLNKVTDPKGNVTNFTYNMSTWNMGSGYRVATITRVCTCGNQVWTFTYNSQDDQASAPFYTSVRDPRSHDWKFYYDGFGRIIKSVDPDGHEQSTTILARRPTRSGRRRPSATTRPAAACSKARTCSGRSRLCRGRRTGRPSPMARVGPSCT